MAKRKITERYKKFGEAPVPKGRILAIGGHESKGHSSEKSKAQRLNIDFISEQILKFFVDELRGKDPLVLVIPTASTLPDEVGKEYKKIFKDLGVTHVEVLDIITREEAENEKHSELIERAAAIYFTGGDQLRLTSILGGTRLLQHIKERFAYDDILIAGTSAGAMALSTPMIYEVKTKGGFLKGDVRVTTGLEFLKNVCVDTHFIERGRIVRIAQCIVTNPACIGLGLEEDTAAYITEGRKVQVIGSGLVTIIDGMGISYTDIYEIETGEPFSVKDLKIHLLADGQRYILPTYDQLHL